MKHQKVQLRKEGVDIAVIKDAMYYLDGGTYKLLDAEAYGKITQPNARL